MTSNHNNVEKRDSRATRFRPNLVAADMREKEKFIFWRFMTLMRISGEILEDFWRNG